MVDDLDDLLRTAMKTLDDQVPPGYFDDLPRQTLARLEDDRMHDEPSDAAASSSPDPAPAATPAAEAKPREEDSDLHDIRNLASSQRMRIRRSSQNPANADDDLLASASGSWRAVALPEPAKMVALPELSELPPASEVEEADRAGPRDSKPKIEKRAEGSPGKAAARPREAAAAVEAPAVTPITAAKGKPAAGKPGKRNALIAAAGFGLAAAAGVGIFVSTQGASKDAAMQAEPAGRAKVDRIMPELRRVEPPATAVIAAPETAAGAAAAAEPAAAAEADRGKAAPPAPGKPTKSSGKYVPNVVDDGKAPDKRKDDPKKKPEPGDPDFDKLLKEAGYQEKKPEAPKLEKKSLSGDDIKKGMNAVAAKVSSCYAGQQGTAAVKLTVLPTGQIQKVTVTGEFAGTPVGACVEGAVQTATFPPWDGGPQSVNYSYLLAE
jgi:hypothetical protein